LSIVITNITEPNEQHLDNDLYVVRINSTEICNFRHTRKVDGLAQCLRDAADAVDGHIEAEGLKRLRLIAGVIGT